MGKEPARHGEIYVCGVTATLISMNKEFRSGPFEDFTFLKKSQKIFPGPAGADPGPGNIFLKKLKMKIPGAARSKSEKVRK